MGSREIGTSPNRGVYIQHGHELPAGRSARKSKILQIDSSGRPWSGVAGLEILSRPSGCEASDARAGLGTNYRIPSSGVPRVTSDVWVVVYAIGCEQAP